MSLILTAAAVAGLAIVAGGVFLFKNKSSGDTTKPVPKDLLKQLPPELAGRYLELVASERFIRQTVAGHGLEPVMSGQMGQLGYMVESYLRLAQEVSRFRTYLQSTPPGALEKELEKIQARFDATDNPDARSTIEQNMAVLRKRLDKVQQIRETAAQLKSQLDTLEDTVQLIYEQALTASKPEDIAVDFDRVVAEVGATDSALAETRALLGTGSLR
jgi:hypothetical protein